MTAPFDAGRRRLLFAAVGLAASASLGLRMVDGAVQRLISTDETRVLRSLIAHPESAAQLGRAYLAARPDEASASRLTSLILDERATVTGDEPARVTAHVGEDFEAGRVVVVNGWILSLTEARLCALCAVS